MRRLTAGLLALRVTGVAALILLLWNPVSSRSVDADTPPLVLLDASLSMGGLPGDAARWQRALDTARALAQGGVIWRFGSGVAAFDTAPPTDGASALAPALRAAAARGGAMVIVTDGELADRAAIPEDLLRRARVVALPREPSFSFDAFVAAVEGPRRVAAEDTVRLSVAYGTAGKRAAGNGKGVVLVASVGGRRIATRQVELPDSGVTTTELPFPVSRFPAGWSVVEVRLEGVRDAEPRDDARLHVLEVSPQPAAAVVAAPPDWDTRFLAAALRDVARVPVRVFVEAAPSGERRWRDGATLAPAATAEVARAVTGARLIVLGGDPARLSGLRARGAVLDWPSGAAGRALAGDWYVEPPPASPLSGALAGVRWDSLPPVTSVIDGPADNAAVTILAARLGRRGAPRPLMVVSADEGGRRAAVLGTGLWRWQFRGDASAVAYRTLVAALVDWLLEGGAGRGERDLAVPEHPQAARGLPLAWRWVGRAAPRDLVIHLTPVGGEPRVDTLRFDAAGRAELRLAPDIYRYTLPGASAQGLLAVEEYSDEWRPAPAVLASQPGAPSGRLATVGLRDRWWLFVVAIAAFAAEWAWRRRMGLP